MSREDFQSVSANSISLIKILQVLFWLIGLAILGFLILRPPLGVMLFWNILIPVAPALLVLAAGLWRNVCPLGTTSLLPDKLGLSLNKKLTNHQRDWFNLLAVVALFVIIPLRHIYFNTSGQATAWLLIVIASVAVVAGFLFERKSGWCSGLCPVHPVEKLYGSGVAFTMPNAHCGSCVHCSVPCPDSTLNVSFKNAKSGMARVSKYLLVGAFPGFVWGWFQHVEYLSGSIAEKLFEVYSAPVAGGIFTLTGYLVLRKLLGKSRETVLMSVFAAATVSCYYWFRLPQLFGFSESDTHGTLINLTELFPAWSPSLFHLVSTVFFIWWMVIRKKTLRSWSPRPAAQRVNVQ